MIFISLDPKSNLIEELEILLGKFISCQIIGKLISCQIIRYICDCFNMIAESHHKKTSLC